MQNRDAKSLWYDYKRKGRNIKQLNLYMFAKTLGMFEWFNLPETIPHRELERQLQMQGFSFITKVDDKLYCFTGGLGGELDEYYNPTKITINNPHLKFNKTLDVKTDGVLIWNDDFKLGLYPLFEKQNTLLVENDINMMVWGYNSRATRLISAPDDKTKTSAEAYLKKIIDGELSVIGENALFEGIKVQTGNGAGGVSIQEMVAYHQYLKSNLLQEIGLSSAFNMKKERLISSEVDQGEDALFPFVYNMMQNRMMAVDAINEMYGTELDVDFGSVWHYKNKKLVDDRNGDAPVVANQPGETETAPGSDPAPVTDTVSGSTDNVETDPVNTGNPNPDAPNNPALEIPPDVVIVVNNTPDDNAEIVNDESSDENEDGNGDGKPAPAPAPVPDPDDEVNRLQGIIDDPDSTDEEKQAAQDKLDEIKEAENAQ